MESETTLTTAKPQNKWKKYSFHMTILLIFMLPIALLLVLDYLDIESFRYFNEKTSPGYSPARFVFEETWKGRMFYLFFIWLFFIESIIDWEKVINKKPANKLKIVAAIVCALIPTIYVLTVNFVPNVSQQILSLGQQIGILGDLYSDNFLTYHWPLSFEYLIIWAFFACAIIIAYGRTGLGTFSISLSLLGTMTFMYMADTLYPMGLFTPLQLFALPTAAFSAVFLQLLGFKVYLAFPVPYPVGSQYSQVALLKINSAAGKSFGSYIGWPCAGVHSLLLFVLIAALFFKRSQITSFRKIVYFVFGFLGTYFVNILRISTILIIGLNDGYPAAQTFHDVYGELYFFTWMFFYILLVTCIQRYMLVEKTRQGLVKLRLAATTFKNKLKQKFTSNYLTKKKV